MSNQSSSGRAWQALRTQVLERDNHLCTYCLEQGRQTQATHVDHIIAKANGGTDALDNLTASCKQCNLSKGTKQIIRKTYINPRYLP